MPAPALFAFPDTPPALSPSWSRISTTAGAVDLVPVVAVVALPLLLWVWGRRAGPTLRGVFALLAGFVACWELAAVLWVFAAGAWELPLRVSAGVVGVGATVLLLRLLPRRLSADWEL